MNHDDDLKGIPDGVPEELRPLFQKLVEAGAVEMVGSGGVMLRGDKLKQVLKEMGMSPEEYPAEVRAVLEGLASRGEDDREAKAKKDCAEMVAANKVREGIMATIGRAHDCYHDSVEALGLAELLLAHAEPVPELKDGEGQLKRFGEQLHLLVSNLVEARSQLCRFHALVEERGVPLRQKFAADQLAKAMGIRLEEAKAASNKLQ